MDNNNTSIITINDIIGILKQYWYVFIILPIICLIVAFCYLQIVEPIYIQKATILVKTDSKSSMNVPSQLNEVINNNNSSLVDYIYTIKSYKIVSEVVENLNLDVSYTVGDGLKNKTLYKDSPCIVTFLNRYNGHFQLKITPYNDNSCIITEMSFNDIPIFIPQSGIIPYNNIIKTSQGEFIVQRNINNSFFDNEIIVDRFNVPSITSSILSRISINPIEDNSNLLQIVCNDSNPERANDILVELLKVYNNSIIEENNNVANNSKRFLDERINVIGKELSEIENKIKDFKVKNNIINISDNAKTYMDEDNKLKSENMQISDNIAVIKDLHNFITNPSNYNDFIPSLTNIGDVSLQDQIQNYNTLLLKRNRLLQNSGNNNEMVRDLSNNLKSIHRTIEISLNNVLRTLQLRLGSSNSYRAQANSNIKSVPNQEVFYLDIQRQQEIKSSLFSLLLQKREENNLKLAANKSNIQIIDEPYGSNSPVFPNNKLIFLIALAIGVFAPLFFFIIRNMMNNTIQSKNDVTQVTQIPIIGEIPRYKLCIKNPTEVITMRDNNQMTDAFRILRYNILSKDVHVIMLTSTIPGEGKSMIARNLCVALKSAGYKSILIDTDIRKSSYYKYTTQIERIGLTDFLSNDNINQEDIIVKDGVFNGVDMIYSGENLNNPSELLMSSRFDELISNLKNEYDYLVLDNVPAMMTADASIVNRVVDITLYVVRERYLNRNSLYDINTLFCQKKFNNLLILLNDCMLSKNSYYSKYYEGYYHKSKVK